MIEAIGVKATVVKAVGVKDRAIKTALQALRALDKKREELSA
ncbi:MAG: hypothetical protein UFR15_07045 [Succiniclasticum sp.]|nr:hypothetical protein [Succiniclasticum sp.]